MAQLTTHIKNIARDLVNNEQLKVSFSYSYKPQNSHNSQTGEWDGPLYLKRSIRFVLELEKRENQVLFFRQDHELLTFLNALRESIQKGDFTPLDDIRAFNTGVQSRIDAY